MKLLVQLLHDTRFYYRCGGKLYVLYVDPDTKITVLPPVLILIIYMACL